jgi:hypothetical protein
MKAPAPQYVAPAMAAAVQRHGESIFIRTLNFASRDHRNLTAVEAQIKAMQKNARAARETAKQQATLVEQPKIILSKDKVPRLSDLSMWPAVSGRKTVGTMEAHVNGLRFTSNKGERVEIAYANIRHAIFQPCESEHTVLLHFHLRHAIILGKKKLKDVQFFTVRARVGRELALRGRGGGGCGGGGAPSVLPHSCPPCYVCASIAPTHLPRPPNGPPAHAHCRR